MGYVPTSPPESGSYITGLHVHNALWDITNSTIKVFDVHDEPASNRLPLLHVTPKLKDTSSPGQKTPPIFSCKVSSCDGSGRAGGAGNDIMTISVPVASEQDARELIERRVVICPQLSTTDKSDTR